MVKAADMEAEVKVVMVVMKNQLILNHKKMMTVESIIREILGSSSFTTLANKTTWASATTFVQHIYCKNQLWIYG